MLLACRPPACYSLHMLPRLYNETLPNKTVPLIIAGNINYVSYVSYLPQMLWQGISR
jgi:hypothetical protein